jgi:hypothetical protein
VPDTESGDVSYGVPAGHDYFASISRSMSR